jgi:8-oxo-dGTP pyrophosphatase MutT (NUDIX family)
MNGHAPVRNAVRVLLVDEEESVLLFRAERPEDGRAFWFPPGGGIEEGEDVRSAAVREVAEETGLSGVALGPEVWRRRHQFEWRGQGWDQRERWFLSRVEHFEPASGNRTADEDIDLKEARWWTLDELRATGDALVPADLASRLRRLFAEGPPPNPTEIGP